MARKKLLDAFDIKEEKVVTKPVADYEIFKDKELLDAIYLAKTEQEVFDLLAKSF